MSSASACNCSVVQVAQVALCMDGPVTVVKFLYTLTAGVSHSCQCTVGGPTILLIAVMVCRFAKNAGPITFFQHNIFIPSLRLKGKFNKVSGPHQGPRTCSAFLWYGCHASDVHGRDCVAGRQVNNKGLPLV